MEIEIRIIGQKPIEEIAKFAIEVAPACPLAAPAPDREEVGEIVRAMLSGRQYAQAAYQDAYGLRSMWLIHPRNAHNFPHRDKFRHDRAGYAASIIGPDSVDSVRGAA